MLDLRLPNSPFALSVERSLIPTRFPVVTTRTIRLFVSPTLASRASSPTSLTLPIPRRHWFANPASTSILFSLCLLSTAKLTINQNIARLHRTRQKVKILYFLGYVSIRLLYFYFIVDSALSTWYV